MLSSMHRNRTLRRYSPGNASSGVNSSRGVALIIVLAMLVLILGLVMAYFSRVTLQRQVASSSAANAQAGALTLTALDVLLFDIRHEIQAGSRAYSGTNTPVFLPLLTPVPGVDGEVAPSFRLQKAPAISAKNILQISRSGTPFFSLQAGYRQVSGFDENGSRRASAISTTQPSRNGRSILPARWLWPHLLTGAEELLFVAPDWIFLDRKGASPVNFSADDIKRYSDKSPSNLDFVTGRFAYVIYDVGGLLDVNIVGNGLPAAENARKGRLHQVSLEGIGGISAANFTDFVAWRNQGEPADPTLDGGLNDPRRTFLRVPQGSQAFVNRQDLIAYAAPARPNSPIPLESLPYLTTFSRDDNAPSYEPVIPATSPGDLEAAAFNPALSSIQFATETVLNRPEGPITVPAGSPVIVRRFPLAKLALLSEASPNAAKLKYYFGLEKNGRGFNYVADIDGRIAKLNEVATLGREPNFFELLQATILTGSLGRNGGNTYTYGDARDEKRNLQIVQIAANIIDQWDADDIPTTLRYPSGNPGAWEEFYGVENLPYINNISLVTHRPGYDRNRVQTWGLFDVWNPHQNAQTPPEGIEAFRIHPKQGKCRISLFYYITGWPDPNNGGNPSSQPYSPLYSGNGSVAHSGSSQSIVSLNQGHELRFDADRDYSEPTILDYCDSEPLAVKTTAPTDASKFPGILFTDDANVLPAIPAIPSLATQGILNNLVEIFFPDKTDPAHWDPAYLDADGKNVPAKAKYGTKAHNACRLYPSAGDEIILELQALVDGSWITYQVVDGIMPTQPGWGEPGLGVGSDVLIQSPEKAPNDFLIDTHHSRAGADLNSRFYGWRQPGSLTAMLKGDPRTTRFGHFGTTAGDNLGTTIRLSPQPYPYPNPLDYRQDDWRVTYTTRPYGRSTSVFERFSGNLSLGFPFRLITNVPDGLLSKTNPARYYDRDGVIRPADGYLGALPTVPVSQSATVGRNLALDRPVILNRPFRSVGELGYVFRDIPWKTIDFFSKQSGDLGLLDVFSVDETEAFPPLVAGKVNLNTPHWQVLAAMLTGTAKGIAVPGLPDPGALSAGEAEELAKAIVAESSKAPFRNRGDLIRRVLAPAAATSPTVVVGGNWKPIIKTNREAPIRTLAEMGTTRTWNLLVDLVVQGGNFTPTSKNGSDFIVNAERRVWVHLAIDRLTGEVLERQVEVIDE